MSTPGTPSNLAESLELLTMRAAGQLGIIMLSRADFMALADKIPAAVLQDWLTELGLHQIDPVAGNSPIFRKWTAMKRKAQRLDQTELAGKVGVTQGTISRFESGERDLDSTTLQRIKDELSRAPGV